MGDCIFCKIVDKKIPAQVVFENENVVAFKDINPNAKIHLLFVHKKHTENINEMVRHDVLHVMDVFSAITEYTEQTSLEESGFRIVTNTGKDSGQIIFHTHFHLLGGEKLKGNLGA